MDVAGFSAAAPSIPVAATGVAGAVLRLCAGIFGVCVAVSLSDDLELLVGVFAAVVIGVVVVEVVVCCLVGVKVVVEVVVCCLVGVNLDTGGKGATFVYIRKTKNCVCTYQLYRIEFSGADKALTEDLWQVCPHHLLHHPL